MIFMPEADTWLRLYPLPGTDISEVVDAFARVMMISALVDKKHKGMFFIGNGVTICRSYEDFNKRESLQQFADDILKEFNKKMRIA